MLILVTNCASETSDSGQPLLTVFVQSCIHAIMKTHYIFKLAVICVRVHLAGKIAQRISFNPMTFTHNLLNGVFPPFHVL